MRTFAILTTPANELVGTIHDRMPAVLAPAAYDGWLGTEPDPRDLLQPFPSELMAIWPISTRVNSPSNDDEQLLEEIELAKAPAAVIAPESFADRPLSDQRTDQPSKLSSFATESPQDQISASATGNAKSGHSRKSRALAAQVINPCASVGRRKRLGLQDVVLTFARDTNASEAAMNALTYELSVSFGVGKIAKPFRLNMAPLCPSRSRDTRSGVRRSV